MEVVGARVLSPDEVGIIEKDISSNLNHKINIDFWYRADTVITDKGFTPFEKYNEQNVKELDRYLREKSVDKTRLNK